MAKRRLPIGIQTFRKIWQEDCYYVDKTAYIRRLLDEGTHYFLSRPRRFGKSLFLDTLKELFEGNEPLFAGLYIREHWDWSVRHPVVRLSFGSGNFKEPGYVQTNLMAQLDAVERRAGIASDYATGPERFAHLLETLHSRAGQAVVVLIDEYDKPILDALEVPEIARANRDFLRGLYAVIKDCDAHVRFAFITGVSKFSGLNNPNREVRQSLNRSLLRYLVKDPSRQMANSVRLYRLLEANDFAGLETLFHAFFASIPYEWYNNNDIAQYEGYASVFYSYFAGLGLDIAVEDSSSHGRLDMAVLFNGCVYLFEFKVVELASAGAAMAQLQQRRYADKYRALGQPIYLIAVEFSKDARNLAAFAVERT